MHDKSFKRTRKEYWKLYDKAMKDPYSVPFDIWDEVTDFLAVSHEEECMDMIMFDPRNMDKFFDSKDDYDKTMAEIRASYKD